MRRLIFLLLALCAAAAPARADWPRGGRAHGDPVLCRVGPSYAAVPDHAGGVITFVTPWDVVTRLDAQGDAQWTAAPYAQTNLAPATRIASDDAGGVWMGWASGADVFVQHWTASGVQVGGTITVCHNTAGVRNLAALVADGAGGTFVMWNDSQSDGSIVDHLLASRVTAAGVVLGPANGVPVFEGAPSEYLAGSAADGLGGVVLLKRAAAGMRLQKVNANLGLAWPAGLEIASNFGEFAVAPAGGGECFVAWCEGSGAASAVRVQRLGANGSPAVGWPAAGVIVASPLLDAITPRVCADGAGGAFVAWLDDHVVAGLEVRDVRVSHVLADASVAPGWPVGGVDPGDSMLPSLDASAIVTDGAGGCYVGWGDLDYFVHAVHVQHLNGDGSFGDGWSASGAPVSIDHLPIVQVTPPVLTADGAGGAYALWNEWRGCAAHESCNQTRLARLLPTGVVGVPSAGGSLLALAAPTPNPTHGRFTVQATLPDERPARVEVFDLAGRVVFARELRGPGRHTVAVEGAAFAPGVHWVRLAHAAGARSARVVMLK